ncbi:MAG: hypothetical protein ACE5IC_07715 [Candidatus Brocadiales bacterium]
MVGCVDEQWVKDYVGQELEPVRAERLKPLEEGLAETREELQSLRRQVEEIGVGLKTPESLEQVLEENRDEQQRLREDLDEMDTRFTALESTVQALAGGVPVLETAPEAVPEPMPEEVRPPGVEAQVPQSLEERLAALANELRKLRARINDVSRHIEHVDEQYQQYHKGVGVLRVDIMGEIDTLNKKVSALDDKISDLKDTQRGILAEMAEQSQKDVETLEQKLRGLIEGLPK